MIEVPNILVGRQVAYETDSRRSPFHVLAVVFDERTGRFWLLVADAADGRIATWNASDAFLLPEVAR